MTSNTPRRTAGGTTRTVIRETGKATWEVLAVIRSIPREIIHAGTQAAVGLMDHDPMRNR